MKRKASAGVTLKLSSLSKKKWLYAVLGVGVATGLIALAVTQAAVSVASIYADRGTLSGNAQLVTDTTASDGKAVAFGPTNPAPSPTPLPNPGSWTNVTGTFNATLGTNNNGLGGMPSECGNVPLVSTVPGQDKVIVGIAQQGLWESTNNGASWSKLGTGAGSAVITNRPIHISYDPTNSNIFYEAGIYNGGGVYKTTDGGVTFTQLGNVTHNDYVSVDYTDPQRKTLVAGTHERSQSVWKSSDGGQTWTNIGANLPAGTSFSSAAIVLNANTYIVDTIQSWAGGETGIWRTTDGGAHWTKVSGSGVNNVTAPTGTPPTVTSKNVIYWPTGGNLAKSTDGGLTWTQVGDNNIQNGRVTELPDGRIVAGGGSNQLIVSADGGITWTNFGAALPYDINDKGVAYNAARGSFYIWTWDCGNVVLTNAVERLQ
jgi:photosystem II stability/assembly factor-like uncharacterized protein